MATFMASSGLAGAVERKQRELDIVLSHGDNWQIGILVAVCMNLVVLWLLLTLFLHL